VIPQQPASNGLKPTDLMHATGTWADTNLKEQLKKDYSNYNTVEKKLGQLRSSLDNHQ
jgi:hypothetical protein